MSIKSRSKHTLNPVFLMCFLGIPKTKPTLGPSSELLYKFSRVSHKLLGETHFIMLSSCMSIVHASLGAFPSKVPLSDTLFLFVALREGSFVLCLQETKYEFHIIISSEQMVCIDQDFGGNPLQKLHLMVHLLMSHKGLQLQMSRAMRPGL